MDYLKVNDVVHQVALAGKSKTELSIMEILIKGGLSGAFLGFATTLAYTAATQTGLDIIGALIFPTGFVMILLLNLELVTGSFAMIPVALFRGMVDIPSLFRNLSWAFIGNLLGGLFYAGLFVISITKFGHVSESLLIDKIIAVSESKTIFYKSLGVDGMIVMLVNALLCNWMVTMGAFMNFTSNATIGKIAAMWIPVFIFFAQGFEHAVVNMFVIPAGMLLGADIGFSDWWIWNQIPVTLGNFVSGCLFTGLAFHLITKKTAVPLKPPQDKKNVS